MRTSPPRPNNADFPPIMDKAKDIATNFMLAYPNVVAGAVTSALAFTVFVVFGVAFQFEQFAEIMLAHPNVLTGVFLLAVALMAWAAFKAGQFAADLRIKKQKSDWALEDADNLAASK